MAYQVAVSVSRVLKELNDVHSLLNFNSCFSYVVVTWKVVVKITFWYVGIIQSGPLLIK